MFLTCTSILSLRGNSCCVQSKDPIGQKDFHTKGLPLDLPMIHYRYTIFQLVVALLILSTFIYTGVLQMFKPSLFKMVSNISAKNRLQMVQLHLHTSSISPASYIASGSKFTKDYKVYYKIPETGKLGSFFHDVPLGLDKQKRTVNMVVEIPRWSHAKMEISKELDFNPIVQDTKKEKLRFINNIYPFHGYVHNYGAIPQTWEDSTVVNEEVNFKGDNDPVDICDIGSPLGSLGEVVSVKVLGSLALIDDGELDWKVIAINEKDPLSQKLNDIEDVEKLLPGVLADTRKWFRDYKVPTGKPKNEFAYNGNYKNASETIKVIEETHESWKALVNGKIQGKKLPVILNSSQDKSKGFKSVISAEELNIKLEQADAELPENLSETFYIN